MGSRFDSPIEMFRRGLRISEAAYRSIKSHHPVLRELVEHAMQDLDKFDELQTNQPPDIAEALAEAQTALNGLATVLERHRPQTTPED